MDGALLGPALNLQTIKLSKLPIQARQPVLEPTHQYAKSLIRDCIQ